MAFSFSRLIISESDIIACDETFKFIEGKDLQVEQRGTASCVGGIGGYRLWLGFRKGIPSWECPCAENIYEKTQKPCSHAVALSLAWDRSRGVPDPSQESIEYLTRKR